MANVGSIVSILMAPASRCYIFSDSKEGLRVVCSISCRICSRGRSWETEVVANSAMRNCSVMLHKSVLMKAISDRASNYCDEIILV